MKKVLIITLQLAVTVFALWWVFRAPETRAGMTRALHEGDPWWLLATLAMAGLPPICATVRFWLLLRVQKLLMPLGRVLQLYMIGMFFNLFLLGSTGGDAVKLFYLLRENPGPERRVGAFLAVVMDRLLGMVALIILSFTFVWVRYDWLTQTPITRRWTLGFVGFLAFTLFGILVTILTAQFNMVRLLPEKMPGRKTLLELAAAIQSNTRAWRTTIACILISFVGHMSMFVVFYFAARVMRASVAFWDITVVMPIINTVAALPVSLSGVGVREALFTTLLGQLCHVALGEPALISLIGFICSVIFYGLVGGVFYLSYRGKAGAVPAHVEEVEAREESAAFPAMVAEVNGAPARPAADA